MPRAQGSHTQAVRLIKILRRLQGRRSGVRLTELQDEFTVSRSQVRRDLLALEEAGLRLAFEQEDGQYGRARVRLLDADTRVPVTRGERFALLAVRRVFDVFRGTPLHRDIDSVYEKLIETLPTDERKDLRALADRLAYIPSGGTKSYEGLEDILEAFETGVLLRRLVKFTYRQRSGRTSTGTLAPYALVIYRNGLYIIGARQLAPETFQDPRTFALERFTEATWLRRSTFDLPLTFRLDDHFDGAFGLITGRRRHHVIIELSKSVRTEAVTRRWHPTQVATPLPNGRVRLEFTVSTLRELTQWLLGWGRHVQVVAPDYLSDAIANDHRDAARG